jgi:molybdopterin-guanine dinucleotide biosynthesis protein A
MARDQMTAVILAGGRSRRMDGIDKAFLEIHGRPLIHWVIDAIQPQVRGILIAADPMAAPYQTLGYQLIDDTPGSDCGPLAGILAGLECTDSPYLLTVPCDTPFLPPTLAARLYAHLRGHEARAVTVHDGAILHATISLLDCRLAVQLREFLHSGGRAVRDWLAAVDALPVDFAAERAAFMNVNTPADLARAEGYAR